MNCECYLNYCYGIRVMFGVLCIKINLKNNNYIAEPDIDRWFFIRIINII